MMIGALLVVRRVLALPFLLVAALSLLLGSWLADEALLDDFADWFFED